MKKNRISLEGYCMNMDDIILALTENIKKIYPNARYTNMSFKDIPPDDMNPEKIYGCSIVDGGSKNPIIVYGFVGYIPKRRRIGYNTQNISDSFLKSSENGRLLVTIEPCDLINSHKKVHIITNREELSCRSLKEIAFENISDKILLGRFHYYVNDEKVIEECKRMAMKISPKLEVLPGISFS